MLAAWAALWAAGGWFLSKGVFRLRRGEDELVGLGLGLVVQIWLANILAHFLPAATAFWVSASVLFVAGMISALASRSVSRPSFAPDQWIALAGLTLLIFGIGRGLAIFDDYQNLPTVSLIAAGDIPPRFALDPTLRFGYHYFLLLFAAELMLLGNMLPWTALDLARALVLALPLVLAGLWMYRITRNRVLGFVGSAVVALAGGARWLLLLLPRGWVERISAQITLIGSAASSAPTLAEAMVSEWKIDGGGPISFPFAFYSGVNQPYVMLHTGIAGSGVLILLLLLLTSQRWRNQGAPMVSTLLLTALAFANEIAFLLVVLGLLVVGMVWLLARRRYGAGTTPWLWLSIGLAALLMAVFQGGMLTELALGWLMNDGAMGSYFDTTPALAWPPAIVSAHLGALSLVNAAQLGMAVLEIGPIVLVTPLLLRWGWRAFKWGKWFEAALIGTSFGVFVACLVTFQGPLYTAAPRLLGGWFLTASLYFVPLVWSWASRRSDWARVGGLIVGAVSCLGGLVMFAVQLAAIQRPVYATFISALDAKMTADHWDGIESNALVFDPLVFRAPTVFGRPTWSSPTWYARYPQWEQLRDAADPRELRRVGFGYMYIDGEYWEGLIPTIQAHLQDACAKTVWQVDGIRGELDYRKDFRRLLDIRSCD